MTQSGTNSEEVAAPAFENHLGGTLRPLTGATSKTRSLLLSGYFQSVRVQPQEKGSLIEVTATQAQEQGPTRDWFNKTRIIKTK